jgi:hypothetical protein
MCWYYCCYRNTGIQQRGTTRAHPRRSMQAEISACKCSACEPPAGPPQATASSVAIDRCRFRVAAPCRPLLCGHYSLGRGRGLRLRRLHDVVDPFLREGPEPAGLVRKLRRLEPRLLRLLPQQRLLVLRLRNATSAGPEVTGFSEQNVDTLGIELLQTILSKRV